MSKRVVLASLIQIVLACYVYVFFEWLFLATQVGFMVSFAPFTKLSALATLPLAAVGVTAGAWLVLVAIDLIRLRRTGELAPFAATTLVPAAVLACLVFLLIDNFTYTVLGFGVVTAGKWLRFLYVPVLVMIRRPHRAGAVEGPEAMGG